jgi:hypothetical protein
MESGIQEIVDYYKVKEELQKRLVKAELAANNRAQNGGQSQNDKLAVQQGVNHDENNGTGSNLTNS